ncbi:spermidine synthase [Aureococcus anophagefferens]|nr:spermidine synthase [Aureococcus anophagefferens]
MSAKAISESPYHVKLKGEKSRRKKKAFRAKEAPPPASPGKRDLLDDHDLVPVEFEAGGEDGTSWFDHLETLEETAKSQSLSLIGVFTGKQKLDLDGDGDADVWDRSAVIGKYLNSTATAFFALWVWVGFGTIFGMVSQKWTFVRSVYFSVAAMSTAGCRRRTRSATATWTTPWPGSCPSSASSASPSSASPSGPGRTSSSATSSRRSPSSRCRSQDDFDNVKDLIASDHVLDFGEFVILELIRQGNVDMETVEGLRDAFEKIDVNGDGTLDRAEVHRYHKATTLRYRYAAYLTKSRGLSRTFALESALELDIEYLVLKAKKLGWLVPVPAAEDKPFEVLIDALDSPDKPDKPDKPASPASRVTPQDK